jgi:YggT family protein
MIGYIYEGLGYFVNFLELLILVRCILSWLPMNMNSPFVALIYRLTEPLLAPIRTLLYRSPLGGPGMTLDISPFLLMLILQGVYGLIGKVLIL